MTKKLLDLSEKIDGFAVELFEITSVVVGRMDLPFFVVGATARDYILELGYGVRIMRATHDVDLGVQVPNWDLYNRLREGLIATERFIPDKKQAQRLLYKGNFPVDIIPFGSIAHPEDRVLWPPEQEVEMSTLGFEEASQHSIIVRMRAEPVLDINFVSLAGLAILKIVSWSDNIARRNKDAKDLLLLMSKYLDAGNDERMFDEGADLLESEDFDYEVAGARLLGRDMAAILRPDTKEALLKILDRETGDQSRYTLIASMVEHGAERIDFEKALQLLEQMKAGIIEKV
jgi:predicted nucleotidyltransferase